jgi:hypothetical protein
MRILTSAIDVRGLQQYVEIHIKFAVVKIGNIYENGVFLIQVRGCAVAERHQQLVRPVASTEM